MSSEYVDKVKNAALNRRQKKKASRSFDQIKESDDWMKQNINDMKRDSSKINTVLEADDKQYVTGIRGKGKKMKDLRISTQKPDVPKRNRSRDKNPPVENPAVIKPKPEPVKKYVTGVKGDGKKMKDVSVSTQKPASPVFRKNIAVRPDSTQKSGEADMDFIMRQSNPNKKTPDAPDWKTTVPSSVAKKKGSVKHLQKKPNIKRASKDKVRIGGMYMYAYDAKTKGQLKYFDEFPLILFLEPAQGGHFGINLHYVPPAVRELILNELLEIAKNSNTDKKYMQLSWSMLKRLTTGTRWEACLKRYLTSHIRSSFYEVEPDSWDYAINLPHAAFVSYTKIKGSRVKVTNTTVWSDTMR